MLRRAVLFCSLSLLLHVGHTLAAGSGADRRSPAADHLGRPLRDPSSGQPINYFPYRTRTGSHSHQSGPRPDSPPGLAYRAAPGDDQLPQLQPETVAPAQFDQGLMREDGVIGSMPQVLGTAGIFAVDVDGDGTDKLIVGHSMLWYLLEPDRARSSYVQRYFNEKNAGATFGGGGVECLRVGDVDGDGKKDLVVLTSANLLEVYDAATGALKTTQSLPTSTSKRFTLANMDGGTDDEILLLDQNDCFVIKLGIVTPLWSVLGVQASDLAAANMDSDPAMEIAFARGTNIAGYVVDGATHLIQYSYPLGFGNVIAAGDIDGDGVAEIAGAEYWGDYMAFDVDTQSLKWSGYNFNTSAVTIADTDNDGRAEVLMGDAQWGAIHVFDGPSGVQRYAINNPEHSVAFIAVGDVTGSCAPKIIWGAGYSSSGDDHLYVASTSTHQIEWQNLEVDGPFFSLAVGDRDADRRTEIVRASGDSHAGYDGALVFVNDFHHRLDEYVPTASTNDGWMVTNGMALLQMDNDPQLEYVMNDSRLYSGKVSAFDGLTHQRQWTSDIYDGEYVSAIAAGDPDGDGNMNVLTGTGRQHTGATGSYVRMYDRSTGQLLWRSPSLDIGWNHTAAIKVSNINGAGPNEILAAVTGWGLMCFNGVTHNLNWLESMSNLTTLETGDVNGDSTPEYILGNTAGQVMAFDGATRALRFQTSFPAQINAIRLADVDGDTTEEMIVCYGGDPGYVAVVRLSDQYVLWRSSGMAGAAGTGESLYVGDVDDDGKTEIVVGTAHAVRFFEYATAAADSTGPVFTSAIPGVSGATSLSFGCCPAIDLSWSPASDAMNPPLEYEIYRGTTSGFVPSSATRVGHSSLLDYRDRSVAASTTYYYVVRAADRLGNEDGNANELSVTSVAGTINTSSLPSRESVCPGGSLTLSLQAYGSISYVWAKDGTPIPGATGSSYQIATASGDDAGSYTCTLTAACGEVTVGPDIVSIGWSRGDVNADCDIAPGDVFYLVNYLFISGPPPTGPADANGDGQVTPADIFYLVNYLFAGGPQP